MKFTPEMSEKWGQQSSYEVSNWIANHAQHEFDSWLEKLKKEYVIINGVERLVVCIEEIKQKKCEHLKIDSYRESYTGPLVGLRCLDCLEHVEPVGGWKLADWLESVWANGKGRFAESTTHTTGEGAKP